MKKEEFEEKWKIHDGSSHRRIVYRGSRKVEYVIADNYKVIGNSVYLYINNVQFGKFMLKSISAIVGF
jgi:hypothetical protein